jgi:type IV pilus assembly protein PilN
MMIKINLLPVRAVQKRELGKQFLILSVVCLAGALIVNYVWLANRQAEAERREAAIADTQRRIAELERVIGEVNNIKRRKDEVQAKLAELKKLETARSGPVRLLDALSSATPKNVWISEFREDGGAVRITGKGYSHDDIAEFMKGLQTVVWTPRGIGRIVERKRDSPTVRVELLGTGALDDVGNGEMKQFFTNVDLKSASQSGGDRDRRVDFEINLTADYTS